MRFTSTSAAIMAAAFQVATAQTFTDCNPLEKTCPADPGLKSSTFSTDFTKGAGDSWSTAAYTKMTYGQNGAEFVIGQDKEAPTMQTDFFFLFGRVDVTMRASPGTGIISSIVLLSDVLDEIDWEFIGGDSGHVQSNFFGKADTSTYDRVQYIPVSSPQDTFHTYSLDWDENRLQYLIDGVVVRTIGSTDAVAKGGKTYPQTPMRLKLGSWCGGCDGSPQGTVEWAGGKTTFEGAPFHMYVKSINIQSKNPADNYVYGDNSGSWQSIKINGAGSVSGDKSNNNSNSTSSSASTTSSAASSTTSAAVVAPLSNTAVVAQTTILASSYSVNTASIKAQNTASLKTTTSSASTATKASSTATPAPAPGAATSLSALGAGSLLSVVLALFMF